MFENLQQKLSGLFSRDGEDRGVSPVIGVILMVAITVILAAVIGAFVLGLGGSLGGSAAPNAQLSMTNSTATDAVVVAHNGGEELNSEELTITAYSGGSAVGNASVSDFSGGSFSAGETIEAAWSTGAAGDVDRVTVVHQPSGSVIAESNVDLPGFGSWNTGA